jgi:cytochrome P450
MKTRIRELRLPGRLGRDTTAQALSWTVFLLLTHPPTLERVTKELRDSPSPETYLASHALGDLTSSNDDSYCPFSNAVITESLRLHPPVPLEVHENTSTQSILLPDRTIVKPGEKVVWSPWAMARSTRIWGSDAASFRPERWLPSIAPGGERKPGLRRTAFEFPVFHAGPRSCLGKQLARIELIFILREVLRRYELRPDWDVAVDRVVGQGLTGPIEGGLPVRVRRRTA